MEHIRAASLCCAVGFVFFFLSFLFFFDLHTYSLWIVGNTETLRKSLVWNALIEDAQVRQHLQQKETHNISVNGMFLCVRRKIWKRQKIGKSIFK
jgi:hypothetical protein